LTRFALRSLLRELRSGELRVLLWGLIVGVAAFCSVGLFTDRIRLGMEQQAGELLAADLVIRAGKEIPSAWRQEAGSRGLQTSGTLSFRSVVLAGERLQLAEVKAVEAGYPLRGELRIADRPYTGGMVRSGPPDRGSIWAEQRLLQLLEIRMGGTIRLGKSEFRVVGIIAYEPDRGGNLFNIAPRLMINSDDVAGTGLLGVGSRSSHRLLVSGEHKPLNAYRRWLKQRLRPGDRLQGGKDSRPQLTSALDRAERFLGLASLVSLLLAAVAIAMAARRYARRQRDTSAVLRCLGASRHTVTRIFILQLLILGIAGSLLGALAGYLAQMGLARIMAELFVRELPPPSWIPVARGLLVGLVTLAGFALPPLLALKDTPPLRVLRRDLQAAPLSRLAAHGPAVAALLGLMAWQAADWKLTLLVAGGSVATLLLLTLAAWGMVRGLGRLDLSGSVPWRFGLAAIPRRMEGSIIQLVAFGLGLMVMLLLSIVRTDLLAAWRGSLPPDAPNHFLINVQRDQLQPLQEFFRQQAQSDPEFFPMVRGRLRQINDRAVSSDDYQETRAQRLVQREFNLSWMGAVPADNQIVAGEWWDGGARNLPEWSVEEGIARTLGITMGDELLFEVAGEQVRGRISSLRKVQWDSFQVNFFVVAPPGRLDAGQASYITAFYLPPDAGEFPVALVKHFPNITDIDVDALMQRVRAIIDRVILSVEFVSLFTLLAGFIVLYAAIQTSLDERLQETAVLRTLGALKRRIRISLATEFVTMGLLAGILASLAASVAGALLAFQLFDLTYTGNPWLWPAGTLAGALGMGLAGVWGTRSVVREPPLNSLRKEG
jgi:putative ABC transport system permease protein